MILVGQVVSTLTQRIMWLVSGLSSAGELGRRSYNHTIHHGRGKRHASTRLIDGSVPELMMTEKPHSLSIIDEMNELSVG